MPPTGERGDEATGIDRRTVIRAVGGAATVGAFATGAAGDDDGDAGGDYAVAQGDECVPVVPLTGDDPVEDLYGLQIPDKFGGDNGATDDGGPYYQSNGTTDLQAVNATITFLYDGPNGLSLVVVHDKPGDEGGGSVSWTVRDVPNSAEWAVKDDLYLTDGEPADNNYDRWNTDGTTHQVDWTWGSAGTDGGALRGLDDAVITVDPAFNEQASLWGEQYAEDPITDWQVLSFPDGRDDPKRTSLDLDRPVTIGAGACDADATTGTGSAGSGDREETSDEPVEISIDVKPGSDRNPINPKSQGVIPVEIIGGNGVDPADVDIDTLSFGAAGAVGANDDSNGGAPPAHSGHTESIDTDDRLVVHFPAHQAGFDDDDEKAVLVGRTEGDRVLFYGSDDVTIVGNGGDRDDDREKDDDDDRDDERDDDDREKDDDDREKDDDDHDDERDDDDQDDERDDDREKDDDDRGGPGRENGNGNNGRGNGNGNNGRGNGNGNGRGNGNGNNGRGNGN